MEDMIKNLLLQVHGITLDRWSFYYLKTENIEREKLESEETFWILYRNRLFLYCHLAPNWVEKFLNKNAHLNLPLVCSKTKMQTIFNIFVFLLQFCTVVASNERAWRSNYNGSNYLTFFFISRWKNLSSNERCRSLHTIPCNVNVMLFNKDSTA